MKLAVRYADEGLYLRYVAGIILEDEKLHQSDPRLLFLRGPGNGWPIGAVGHAHP